jgi:hypothetical protein
MGLFFVVVIVLLLHLTQLTVVRLQQLKSVENCPDLPYRTAPRKRQKAKGKRQKLFVFSSIDDRLKSRLTHRILDGGKKACLKQLLHSAFCLLTFAFREEAHGTCPTFSRTCAPA